MLPHVIVLKQLMRIVWKKTLDHFRLLLKKMTPLLLHYQCRLKWGREVT